VALSRGTQLESCEILELLGSGGMGEVYRGRDTRLGREVAIKALPEKFANDAERMARFEREAQALAALNHPNIAVIHELKEVGAAKYLILELVEGENLAQILARGPLPIDEALSVAKQIAEAVEAAHDRGIVHRDLKPSNIKVTPEDRVKVLDFGLAKIYESPKTSQSMSRSPTMSGLNTAAGVLLGTAAYMSPEQARGRDVDRRADVWAFGCILYEMLTGRQAFAQGETVADTLAGILARDPDWQALPEDTPPKIRALLQRCLRKDPVRRLQDMGNARIEIEEAKSESEAIAAAVTAPPVRSRTREVISATAVLVSFLIMAGLVSSLMLAPDLETPVMRFEAIPPGGLTADGGFTVSPDGLKIAFVTSQPNQIWVRNLDSNAAEAIPSTDGVSGSNIFWSPDSRHIGFFAENKVKRVAATGGPSQVLASLAGGGNYYGTWSGAQDVILVASDANPGGPLLRVPAGSGEAAPATELDKTRKETSHRFPYFLPDGRHYLFLVTGADDRDRSVYVGDLDSKDRHRLPGIAAEARYSDGPGGGHLVFIRDGALIAQPFDAENLQLTGESFPIADPFAPVPALTYPFSASLTGALSFRTSANSGAGGGIGGITQLVWYAKSGNRTETAGAEAEFRGPELSRDARYVAFERGGPSDIYILDIQNARTERLTSHAADDLNPRWSPDGKTIAFDSARDGGGNLYTRAVGVASEDKLLLKTEGAKTMGDWSRDGKYIAYVENNDIWALPVSRDPKTLEWTAGKPVQVTKTEFIEATPRISPDGRWVAYASNEQGEFRVYVQAFPEPGGTKRPVSTAGAIEPRWSWDGKEIFFYTGNIYPYVTGSGAVWVAAFQASGSSISIGAPGPRAPRLAPGSTSYSVAEDGRFLLQTVPGVGGGGGRGMQGRPVGSNREIDVITIILNWAGRQGGSPQ
jgi:Tol biopolymer transport system component